MRKEGIVWVLLKSKPDKWYKAGFIKNGKKDEFFSLCWKNTISKK